MTLKVSKWINAVFPTRRMIIKPFLISCSKWVMLVFRLEILLFSQKKEKEEVQYGAYDRKRKNNDCLKE